MLTDYKSTMRVLCMLMRWSSGHVTLLRGKFQPFKFPPNRTYSARQTHVGLCLIFLALIMLRRLRLMELSSGRGLRQKLFETACNIIIGSHQLQLLRILC